MSFPQGMINQQTGVQTAPEAATEQIEVDLNEKVEVKDSTVDSNIVPPPPKAGKYPVKWSLGEKGVQVSRSDKVGSFLNVYLLGHVQADGTEYHDFPITEYMNSIYDKLKGTSPLHSFMNKLGVTVPNSTTLGDLKNLVESTLAQNPVGNAEIEWRSQELNPTSKKQRNGYVTIRNRMSQYKKNPDGTYDPMSTLSEIDGSPVPARAYILAHVK